MTSLSTMALLLALSVQPGVGRPIPATDQKWSSIKVDTTWVPPKSQLEPMGTPTSYRWKSSKGAILEITPVKGKWADQLKLTIDDHVIPLSTLASLKVGWSPRFGPLIYPCGYNMISELAVPVVERKTIGAFEIFKAQWPNNMNGIPQTCYLIVILSTDTEDSLAIGFEGERASFLLRSEKELLVSASGTSRPKGFMEGWSQSILVRCESNRLNLIPKPLASYIPK